MNLDPSIYKEEALELLQELEKLLLKLEYAPSDKDLINNIFRNLHTIKGSGAMYGFENISTFTHKIENVFDIIRKNDLIPDKSIIEVTLAGCDYIRNLVEKY